ncbi:Phage holin [compost metagenome]
MNSFNNEVLNNVLLFSSVILVFVNALMGLIKTTVSVPKNLIPLIALVVGALTGVAASPFTDLTLVLRFWAGALAGLSSVGLFEIFNKRDGVTK